MQLDFEAQAHINLLLCRHGASLPMLLARMMLTRKWTGHLHCLWGNSTATDSSPEAYMRLFSEFHLHQRWANMPGINKEVEICDVCALCRFWSSAWYRWDLYFVLWDITYHLWIVTHFSQWSTHSWTTLIKLFDTSFARSSMLCRQDCIISTILGLQHSYESSVFIKLISSCVSHTILCGI